MSQDEPEAAAPDEPPAEQDVPPPDAPTWKQTLDELASEPARNWSAALARAAPSLTIIQPEETIMNDDLDDDIYTIGLDEYREPVQRPLDAMTADEVLRALAFHHQEAFLMSLVHAEAERASDKLRFGERPPTGIEAAAQIDACGHVMGQARAATAKSQLLYMRVSERLTQKLGEPHFSTPLEELVRLHWSGAAQSVS